MFNKISINEVLNTKYKYPDKYIDPKTLGNTGKTHNEDQLEEKLIQDAVCSCYLGQKLHRCLYVFRFSIKTMV